MMCGERKPLWFVWLMPSRQSGLPSQQNGFQAKMPGVGL
jgi:hypothetical protein